jgi:hypothetical protein
VSAPAKLAGFAAVLAVLFGGGAAAGGFADPDAPNAAPETTAEAAHAEPAAMKSMGAGEGGHAAGGAHGAKGKAVRGLAVADNGLRLVVDDPDFRRGRTEQLRFRIVDDRGRAVRDFDVEHTKRMHVIVARRDLTGFQHLHPRMAADGTWTTALRLPDAGSYRVFADFSHDDEATTLAGDLRVDGGADLRPLTAPASMARSDGGYDVRLESRTARAGRESELRFTVLKDGHPVHVEPYLGADGHLVAMREGDLAFLHVHPADHGHEGTAAKAEEHDDSIGFEATFPTTGHYGLFLQFKHEGGVHTVAFTQEVK